MRARVEGKTEMSELYHQLSTLLKSSMVASRMTPMHRYYVKKQSADTFVILYRVSASFIHFYNIIRSNRACLLWIWEAICNKKSLDAFQHP